MNEDEKERLTRIRSEYAKDKALAVERERQSNRKEMAIEKKDSDLAREELRASSHASLELLKAQLQPEQLETLHHFNKKERSDIRRNNDLELSHATDCDIDKMLMAAQIKISLMEKGHELNSKSNTELSDDDVSSLIHEIMQYE